MLTNYRLFVPLLALVGMQPSFLFTDFKFVQLGIEPQLPRGKIKSCPGCRINAFIFKTRFEDGAILIFVLFRPF